MSQFHTETVHHFNRYLSHHSEVNGKHPLFPVLTSLTILGIKLECKNNDNEAPLWKLLFKLHFVIVFFFYHYWAISDILWYFQNRIQEEVLADSVTNWTAVCTVDFLLFKRKEIRKFLIIVASETSMLSPEDKKKFRRIVIIACVAVWMLILLYMSQYVILSNAINFHKFFSNTPYILFEDNFSEYQKLVIYKVDQCFESFFIEGSLTMIIVFYILLCYSMTLWFRRFAKDYDGSNLKENVLAELKNVREFRTDFEDLSNKVKIMDNIFSLSVAAWLLMILINLCVRILAILNPFTLNTPETVFLVSLSFIRAAITLIGVSFAADAVQKEALNALEKIDSMIRKDCSNWNNSLYHEVQLAFIKYSCFPTHLTVWKFASLNRSFLITFLGMMVTYVIICIQLNPTAMNRIKGS